MTDRVVEGQTVNLVEFFLDDYEDALYPAEGYAGPSVEVKDETGDIIASGIASPGDNPGEWQIDLGVPVLNLLDVKTFPVVWKFVDELGDNHRARNSLTVEPKGENRITDIVFLNSDTTSTFQVILPIVYNAEGGDSLKVSLYKNNDPIFEGSDASGMNPRVYTTRTELDVPKSFTVTRFEPLSLMVEYVDAVSGRQSMLTYKVWAITPQINIAGSMIEDHINKARIANIIPELEYTPADLIIYLYRGLQLFNQYRPRITAFTGTNMQGFLLDCWVICGSYYALAAQLQAEGALAFDFSGQTVNLNVDRSPSIEAALGRIEQQLENQVKQVKGLLGKAGITGGDGSIGSQEISGAKQFGVVGVTDSPTTKFGNMRGSSMYAPIRRFGRF